MKTVGRMKRRSNMGIKLMSHQIDWVNDVLYGELAQLREEHGLALFGEAGTGKTYPASIAAKELVKEHGGHALFVVPTRLVWNWALEFSKVCPDIPAIQLLVINGTKEERHNQLLYLEAFRAIINMFVVIGYDALRIHQQYFQNFHGWTVLACDEAHKIKNAQTQTARAVKSINARYRLALTGTPITNRPNDLWSVLHFLDPGPEMYRETAAIPARPGRRCPHWETLGKKYRRSGCAYLYCDKWDDDNGICKLGTNRAAKPSQKIRYRRRSPTWGSYNTFVDSYCRIIRVPTRRGVFPKIVGGKNMDHLHSRLGGFGVTRWLLDDVVDLPPYIFNHIHLEPTVQEQRNYRLVAQGIINMLMDTENGEVGHFQHTNPLAILTYLRQCTVLTPTAFAALRGGLLDEILAQTKDLSKSDKSSKEEWLLDFLEDINGEKVLVYCHWIGALDHLYRTLTDAGYEVERIYGNHGKGKHDARRIMEDFAAGDGPQIIIGNESMAEGLNFQAARYVVFMHLDWLPKTTIQFIGRARRIGQTKRVVVYFLSQKDTVDVDMAEQCLQKQMDSEHIFEPEFASRSKMFDIDTRAGLINLIRRE